jgi:hypothetical protein
VVAKPSHSASAWRLLFSLARRERLLVRVQLAFLYGSLAIALGGCWPAMLLPLAANVAGDVASTVANVGEGAIIEAHQGQNGSGDANHKGETEGAHEARCTELQMDAPGVIEVRRGTGGAPQYRQLELSSAVDQPHWTVMVDQGTDTQGWLPAAKLLAADFKPPLGPLPDGSSYLAYMAVQSDAPSDASTLSMNFGSGTGTFDWKGQLYLFSMAHQLPCFPPPAP